MQTDTAQPLNRKILVGGALLTLVAIAAMAFWLPRFLNDTSKATGSDNLVIGRAFPPFQMQDLKGNVVTPTSLAGKPYILWFTAGWCVPCQVGAERVAKLDNALGGNAFNVAVVFIDAKEPAGALRRWQQKHASADWFIGFDDDVGSLQRLVSLQYLDSKYLVDANGILRDVDFQIARDDYLTRIRKVVEGAGNG